MEKNKPKSIEEQGKFEVPAAKFVSAIREMACKPENMENFESYLSRHFGTWLDKYASSPENLAAEMREFATMKI